MLDPKQRNLRLDPVSLSDTSPPVIKSRHDAPDHGERDALPGDVNSHGEQRDPSMPSFDPDDLVGRTFLSETQEDGQRFRVRIVKALEDHACNLANHPNRVKFVCSVNDEQFEEVMSYADILQHLESAEDKDNGAGRIWRFRRISGHQGPLAKTPS